MRSTLFRQRCGNFSDNAGLRGQPVGSIRICRRERCTGLAGVFAKGGFFSCGIKRGSDMMVWRGHWTGTWNKEGGDDQNNRR